MKRRTRNILNGFGSLLCILPGSRPASEPWKMDLPFDITGQPSVIAWERVGQAMYRSMGEVDHELEKSKAEQKIGQQTSA